MSYNPFTLENKTILITGASSGIGKETAIECSKLGANLIITGRNEERLIETFNLLAGNNHIFYQLDLNSEDNIQDFLNSLPKLDGIVHSAGILESIPFSFTNSEKLAKIMKVNFEMPFTMTQSLIKTKKIITGTTYTFLNEDRNKILHFTSNSDVTVTIPIGLDSNNRYEGKQLGSGQIIFGTDIGVTLRIGSSETNKTAEQYSVFGLDVIGTEEYMLYGKLELV
jgi:NAD(P)-dependent dehydrogenase (short-subunit alcohol dehydrogenase family)